MNKKSKKSSIFLSYFINHASLPPPPLPPHFSLTISKQQYKKSNRSKSQRVFYAHVGMESSKSNQTRWEWHNSTVSPSLHLVPFCQLCTPKTLYMHLAYSFALYNKVLSIAQSTVFHLSIYAMFSNNKISQQSVKELWCHSILVWLLFEGSIPTCACFHSKNVLWLIH